jgi:hypothetical protein
MLAILAGKDKTMMNANRTIFGVLLLSAFAQLAQPKCLLFARASEESQAVSDQTPWTPDRAWAWFKEASPIRGVNYEPRTAVNVTDIWQSETFDLKTIDQELGWAQSAGYNNLRTSIQYLVWEHDPEGFKKRMDQFLAVADKHGMRVMPVLFDDCAHSGREPYLGKQDDPIPGVHNSQWVPSPGHERVTNRAAWPMLEKYIKDIVGTFGGDRRVLIWDLYNEPGNYRMGEKSLPLVEAAFAWARSVHPSQPLTTAVWGDFNGTMSHRMMQLSDIVSFHSYDVPERVISKIEICRTMGRPMLCTEWLFRQDGNTFAAILPIFAEHNVGWYSTALVAGKIQAYMPRGSKKGDPMPKVWQHDVFWPDGTPYDPAEIELIKAWRPANPDKR